VGEEGALVGGGQGGKKGVDRGGVVGVGPFREDVAEEVLAGAAADGVEEVFGLLAEPVEHRVGLQGELAEQEDGPVDGGRLGGGGAFAVMIVMMARAAFGVVDRAAEFGGSDAEADCDVVDDGVLGDLVGDDGHEFGEVATGLGELRGLGEVAGVLFAVDSVVEELGGLVEEPAEGVGSGRFDEGVGVLAGREGGDADVEAGGGEFAEGGHGGLFSCGVGVEADDGGVGVAFQEAGVGGGEGRAEGGDSVPEGGLMAGDDVDLAFAEEGELFLRHGATGLVETEEDGGLPEEDRFGGVDVFPGAGIVAQLAAAEGDDVAVVVVDGKHEAVAEAQVEAGFRVAFLAEAGEAGVLQFAAGETLGASPIEEDRGFVGHPADQPALGHIEVISAAFEVFAGVPGAGVFAQEAVHEACGAIMQFEEAGSAAAGAVRFGVEGFFLDGDVGAAGEFAYRIGEGEVLVSHHEADGAAALAAAEALVALSCRIDGEGGGLFVVERAERLEDGPGAFQREVPGDDLDDIAARQDLLDRFLRNAGHRPGNIPRLRRLANLSVAGGKKGMAVPDAGRVGNWRRFSWAGAENRPYIPGMKHMAGFIAIWLVVLSAAGAGTVAGGVPERRPPGSLEEKPLVIRMARKGDDVNRMAAEDGAGGAGGNGDAGEGEFPGKTREEPFTGKVVVLEVGERDLVNKQSFKFWRRMLRRAEDEEAAAVVFEIDTPGGLAFDTKEIMTEITRLSIPSFAFVEEDALSAGALVSVATDAIYMRPGSVIGSAGLVSSAGEMDPMMRRKLEALFDAHVRGVVKKKGYNIEVVRAMMVPVERDRYFGEVLVKENDLLALNAEEAVAIVDGERLLAKGLVGSIEELLAREGLEEFAVVRAEPTPFEHFAWWVAYLSPLLILVGIGAAYAEMKAPGFGVGGVISLAAFGIFFFGNYVAGNLAGYEMVAVFVLGVALILVEIFLIPGTGVTGFIGAGLIVASLLFGMVDRIEWADWMGGELEGGLLELLAGPALNLALGLIGALILMLLMMRYLPKVSLFNPLMLQKELAGGASVRGAEEVVPERTGWTGEAVTDLRPAGKATFRDETLDVVTDGEFVAQGAKVRVVREDGMKVVVQEIQGS